MRGVANIIIRTGSRLLVVCGKNIDWRGIGNGAWFAPHIPQAQMFQYLLYYVRVFDECNDTPL